MKQKIITQAVCAILIFIVGFAYGGYRGSYRATEQRNVGDLFWYTHFYKLGQKNENEKVKETAAMGINMVVGILRESESGALSSSYWLNAFSLGDDSLAADDVDYLLKSYAKYPISDVPELTEENLAYLKSKME